MNAETMGGRRSRYWCGPGSFRETKKAVTPDRNQAGGAPRIFLKRNEKGNKEREKRNNENENY